MGREPRRPAGRRWIRYRLHRQIDPHDIRVLLHLLDDELSAVARNVEVADHDLASEIRQRPLVPGLQIDQPDVLVPHLALEDDQREAVRQERKMARSAREDEIKKTVRPALGGRGSHLKCRPDVRARIDDERTVGRPDRIDRIFRQDRRRSASVQRHSVHARCAGLVGRRHQKRSARPAPRRVPHAAGASRQRCASPSRPRSSRTGATAPARSPRWRHALRRP